MRVRMGLVGLAMVALSLPVAAPRAAAFSDHDLITAEGLGPGPASLSFLRRAVLEDILDEHDVLDGGFLDNNLGEDQFHFDDCEFDGTVSFIHARYSGARSALVDLDVWKTTREFGRALHPIQDFYSHSNWIELGFPLTEDDPSTTRVEVAQSDLVDLSGAQISLAYPWWAWPGSAVVRNDILLDGDDWAGIQDGWTIERNGGGLFVPTLVDPQGTTQGRLLVTGQSAGGPGNIFADDECDVPVLDSSDNAYTGIYHSNLAKDCPTCGASTIPEETRRENFAKARALAVLQTGYEWCRLVREARLANHDGLLLAMWVRAGASPHPPGTPCQENRGPIPVTVTIRSVQVLDSGDRNRNDPGEIQLAAVLYDDPLNFNHSVHATNRSGQMALDDGQFVPANQLPEPMTVCVSPGESSSFALHAWDNDDPSDDPFELALDRYGDDDEILVGFRKDFGDQLPAGVQVAGSADLEVEFQVSRVPAGAAVNPCAPLQN